MTIKKIAAFVAGSVFSISFFAFPAQAASVTTCGDNICYEYDDAQSALALYSTPFVVGDQIIFTPSVFRAESINGVGIHPPMGNTDSVNATFIFSRVYTMNGKEIQSLWVAESGDYRIDANGPLPLDDDGFVDALLRTQTSNNSAPFQVDVATDYISATGDSGGKQEWELLTMQKPDDLFSGPANDLRMSIQNTLTAYTDENGEHAWIEKKLVVGAAVVPVPAAVWLFGSALGMFGFIGRRRSAKA